MFIERKTITAKLTKSERDEINETSTAARDVCFECGTRNCPRLKAGKCNQLWMKALEEQRSAKGAGKGRQTTTRPRAPLVPVDAHTKKPVSKTANVVWDESAPGEMHEKFIWKGEGAHGPIRTIPYSKGDAAPVQTQGIHLGPKIPLPDELVGSEQICYWDLRAGSGFFIPWKHFKAFCLDPKCNKIHKYYAYDTQIKKCVECHQQRLKEDRERAENAKAQAAYDECP